MFILYSTEMLIIICVAYRSVKCHLDGKRDVKLIHKDFLSYKKLLCRCFDYYNEL